eukprot:Clim_evm29s109 gene=Clim_evmTU29s109
MDLLQDFVWRSQAADIAAVDCAQASGTELGVLIASLEDIRQSEAKEADSEQLRLRNSGILTNGIAEATEPLTDTAWFDSFVSEKVSFLSGRISRLIVQLGQRNDYEELRTAVEALDRLLPVIQADAEFIIARSREKGLPVYDNENSVIGRVPINGYLSLIYVMGRALKRGGALIVDMEKAYSNTFSFFNQNFWKQEIMDMCAILSALLATFALARETLEEDALAQESCDQHTEGVSATDGGMPYYGTYFPKDKDKMNTMLLLNCQYFYGRRFGFVFPSSVKRLLKIIVTATAGFADGYASSQTAFFQQAVMALKSVHYVMHQQSRSQALVKQFAKGDVEFTSTFFNLLETTVAKHYGKIASPTMALNRVFKLPVMSFRQLTNGMTRGFDSEDPSDVLLQAEKKFVQVRLLSANRFRVQMRSSKDSGNLEAEEAINDVDANRMAKQLIMHFHGGGFIAQTSLSHEVYLRLWAKEFNIPVVSVDYSLSPENHFPVAVYEAFYAYCWSLRYHHRYGVSNLDEIVLCGDSAGANLCIAICLLCHKFSIRMPTGIVIAYPPLNMEYDMAASRMLSIMDPMLPSAVLKCCLEAYIPEEEKANRKDPLASPIFAADDQLGTFPPCRILTSSLDPLFDDSMVFAKRLDECGVDVIAHVFSTLPHGFWNFAQANSEAFRAFTKSSQYIAALLGKSRK